MGNKSLQKGKNINDFKTSIILVNYNSTNYTIDCIYSIRKRTSKSETYEIIVVDNNSRTDEREKLKDWLNRNEQSEIKKIFLKKNKGFTGGNMEGVKIAKGKYIYLLNNDCILINDVISILCDFMDNNKNVAAVSPQMLNDEGNPVPAFSYMPTVYNKWFGNKVANLTNPTKYPYRKKVYKQPIKVEVITGASMFLRNTSFYDIGYMDISYFLYLEEEDLCMNFARHNYDIYHVPEAVIQHFGSKSTIRNLDISREYYISLCYFLRKWYTQSEYQIIKTRYIIRELFGSIRSKDRFKLFLFLLKGAPQKYSLRYKQ